MTIDRDHGHPAPLTGNGNSTRPSRPTGSPKNQPQPPAGGLLAPADNRASPSATRRSRAGCIDSRRAAETTLSPKPPYQQGKLDGLCGLYAIMNAIAAAGDLRLVDDQNIRRIFADLVETASDIYGGPGFIARGLSIDVMEQFVMAAVEIYQDHLGIQLTLTDPDDANVTRLGTQSIDHDDKRLWLERASTTPSLGVILRVEAPWVWHWSVLRAVTPNQRVLLHDSYGIKEVPIDFVTPWRVVVLGYG